MKENCNCLLEPCPLASGHIDLIPRRRSVLNTRRVVVLAIGKIVWRSRPALQKPDIRGNFRRWWINPGLLNWMKRPSSPSWLEPVAAGFIRVGGLWCRRRGTDFLCRSNPDYCWARAVSLKNMRLRCFTVNTSNWFWETQPLPKHIWPNLPPLLYQESADHKIAR